MYKILGDDGQEYGPVSAEQVRKWIRENRLEKKSPVFPKGAGDWVFVGSLPEFAEDFEQVAAGTAADHSQSSGQNRRAQAAFYLGIFAAIPVLGALLGWVAFVTGWRGLVFYWQNPAAGGKVQAWVGIVLGGVFGLGYSTLIVLALLRAMAHQTGTH